MADRGTAGGRPPVGLVYDEAYLRHLTGPGHPERPGRLEAVIQRLQADFGFCGESEAASSGAGSPGGPRQRGCLMLIAPLEGRMEWVRAVHGEGYIETARRDILSGEGELSTGDTAVCAESFDVAMLAVGGVIAGVEAVSAGRACNVFCAVRPPGHHAEPDRGMGFCIFNNAAVAARYAQGRCGFGKVLIVDWDIHHGNGTQEAFYEDGSVFYFSTHLRGLYPMPLTGLGYAHETGAGPGEGTNLNVPLGAGAGDEEVLTAFREKLVPAAEKFRPELAIISAGFDSRVGDPLGVFNVTDEGFAELTRIVMGLVPPGRVVSVLEGGYNAAGLASAVAAHVGALMGHAGSK